jgi:alanyl-tRNA synthetase
METTALYLTGAEHLQVDAIVIETGTDNFGNYILTDQTPAYPQSGGQPGDKGSIQTGGNTYNFTNTRRIDGGIRHYITEKPDIETNTAVSILIDEAYRGQSSKIHTAGHLIASLLHQQFGLTPVKGYHFHDGSYVEVEAANQTEPAAIAAYLADKLPSELLTAKIVSARFAEPEDLSQSPFIPQNTVYDPSLRLVTIAGYPAMLCAGTHVNRLDEIGAVVIGKIKGGKDVIRISYSCPE